MPIIGPLLSRGDWLTGMFGIMSYADVGNAIETAFADPSVNAVLLEDVVERRRLHDVPVEAEA